MNLFMLGGALFFVGGVLFVVGAVVMAWPSRVRKGGG